MDVLLFTLKIMAFAGMWQPYTWSSFFKNIIYKSYAAFLSSGLYVFSLSQCMNMILNVDNSDEFIESLFMMLTVLVAGIKQTYFWVDHQNIKSKIDQLTERPFRPCDSQELTIQRKFEKVITKSTWYYLILISFSVGSILLSSFILELRKRELSYKAWVPFNYTSSTVVFFFVYAYQLIGVSTSGLVNLAHESLICGFLVHICCQLEILGHRFAKVAEDRDTLAECVDHHNLIFTYAYQINNMFAKIIAMQFGVSMLVVCSNLYRLAMVENYVNFTMLLCYSSSILAQIFIYCWFGNEVKLKCREVMDSIYEIDWLELSKSDKRDLIFIMKRTTDPVEFSSAHIITMNVDSFVSLLKMSYSVFNLLRQTNE